VTEEEFSSPLFLRHFAVTLPGRSAAQRDGEKEKESQTVGVTEEFQHLEGGDRRGASGQTDRGEHLRSVGKDSLNDAAGAV